ncbi:MAG: vWA domain-containing protein [Terriglobales bacterium]
MSHTTLIGMSGANSEPSKALTAADFRVTVGGKAASVQSATPAERPPRVVILLDASANHDESTWAATQRLVDEFLAGFHEVGDFTLLTFDEKVQRFVHDTNRVSLQGALGEMFPSGKRESEAGLVEAVRKGSDSLGAYRQGDAEFLITTADQIHKEAEQALSQQRVAGVRLFGASFDQSRRFGPDRFGVDMTVENYSPLEAVVKASGGLWIWFDMSRQDATATVRSVTTAGKSIASLVRNYLTLELRLATPITKPEKLKIELVKGAKVKGQDRFATYPQELFPCQ